MDNKPMMIYHKKADNCLNRVVIPKPIIDKMGKYYKMEVYQDKLILIPMNKEQYNGR